jgi:hypothetical protein
MRTAGPGTACRCNFMRLSSPTAMAHWNAAEFGPSSGRSSDICRNSASPIVLYVAVLSRHHDRHVDPGRACHVDPDVTQPVLHPEAPALENLLRHHRTEVNIQSQPAVSSQRPAKVPEDPAGVTRLCQQLHRRLALKPEQSGLKLLLEEQHPCRRELRGMQRREV